jgi:hypothetical protein
MQSCLARISNMKYAQAWGKWAEVVKLHRKAERLGESIGHGSRFVAVLFKLVLLKGLIHGWCRWLRVVNSPALAELRKVEAARVKAASELETMRVHLTTAAHREAKSLAETVQLQQLLEETVQWTCDLTPMTRKHNRLQENLLVNATSTQPPPPPPLEFSRQTSAHPEIGARMALSPVVGTVSSPAGGVAGGGRRVQHSPRRVNWIQTHMQLQQQQQQQQQQQIHQIQQEQQQQQQQQQKSPRRASWIEAQLLSRGIQHDLPAQQQCLAPVLEQQCLAPVLEDLLYR